MKNLKSIILILLLVVFFQILLSIFPQNILAQNISFSFAPRLWGLDLFIFINDFPLKINDFSTFQTIIGIGGGWESYGYFRDSSNNPVDYDENSSYSFYFNRIDIIGTFGFAFLFMYNDIFGKYNSHLRFKFVTNYQSYEQQNDGKDTYLSQTNLADKEGIFQNSLLIEYYLDFLKYSSKYHTVSGFDFLISYELFPEIVNQVANFSRIQAKIRGFLTILENESLSIYLADRVFFYYIPTSSEYVPVSALTMGSIGYSARGVNWCQYEGTIKLVNNFDVRIFLPTFFNQSFIIPGFIFFFDIGVSDYENLDGNIDFNLMRYSMGAALVITVLGIDLIDFYIDYSINDSLFTFKLRFALYF